jgi:hypothetical protein
MNQKRDIPLFIIDNSRSHGRGREKDFVACTSCELPWYGEITILNERELEIDQDWQKRNTLCAYTEPNEAGIRAKLKVTGFREGLYTPNDLSQLQSLMRRCLEEWRIRRGTVAVDLDDITPEAVVKFANVLLEQTRENLRENPRDKQAYMVGCILTKIRDDYSKK